MTFAFDPHDGLIIVHTEILGPRGTAILRLALDTGATRTLINAGMLVAIGYDPATAGDRVQITTGSGIEFVPRVELKRISALDLAKTNFSVLCHTLPASAAIDGLLGLDFLRGRELTIDFARGDLHLE